MNNIQTTKKSWRMGRFLLFNFSFLLLLAACEKPEVITPGDNNGNSGSESLHKEIIYSVGATENRLTLTTEAEWDNLLERLCDQAQNGNNVTFYNISQTVQTQDNAKGATKDNRTINTASREEIKNWMKEMEQQGLTVQVSYDEGTGRWNGVAYATLPAGNTSGTLIGSWHFICMVATQTDADGNLLGSDLYETEEGAWYYTFTDNGTVTLTIQGMDGTTATENGTWTLSNDGVLSSELMPNGVSWNVNWISTGTMILSCSDLGTAEGNLYFQLQFEKI